MPTHAATVARQRTRLTPIPARARGASASHNSPMASRHTRRQGDAEEALAEEGSGLSEEEEMEE